MTILDYIAPATVPTAATTTYTIAFRKVLTVNSHVVNLPLSRAILK